MLELSRELGVTGHRGPAVLQDLHVIAPGVDHWLYGEEHPLAQDRAFARLAVMKNARRVMKYASQAVAAALLDAGSLGIVYPAVRRRGGTNIACFRPVMVGNVRRGATYRLTWRGDPEPEVTIEVGVQPAARRARRSASDSPS